MLKLDRHVLYRLYLPSSIYTKKINPSGIHLPFGDGVELRDYHLSECLSLSVLHILIDFVQNSVAS